MCKRARGFGLVEVMAGIAVAMIVMMVGLNWMASERRRAIGDTMVVRQAREFGALTRALADHLNNAAGLPTALDTPFDVAVSDLVTAQRLPSGFGIRMGSSVPVALTGQAYTLRGVKKSDGYRGVVYLEGTPSADVLARAGIEDAGLFWQQVAKRLDSAHLVQAGILGGPGRAFDANVSGFAYDVSGVVPGTHALSTVVALANYSDLNTIPPVKVEIDPSSVPSGGGGGGGGPNTEGRACYMNTTTGGCNAGYEKVWSYTACERWGPEYMSEPANTTVSIGGSTLTITKTLQASGNTYRFPATSTVTSSNYWQPPSTSSGGGYYDASCPGSYTFYATYCGNTPVYSWDMYCNYNGTWRTTPPTPGAWCSDNYAYKASTNTAYSSGISSSVAAIAAYGPNLTLPDNNLTVTPAEALTATAAQTIPVCAGSTYAVPLTVSRITGSYNGSAWREYVASSVGSAYSNVSYREQVLYTPASINVTVTCVTRTVSNLGSVNLAAGVTGINGCATQYPPDYQGYKSHQLFEYRLPAANRQKLAFCCATQTP